VSEHLTRSREQSVVPRGEDEWPVRGLERLVRTDVGVGRPHRPGHDAADEEVGGLVHHGGRARIEQRHAYMPAPTGCLSLVESGEDADRRLQARDDIEQGHPSFHGLTARLAGDAHEARQRLDDDVVARAACGVGHFLVERGQGTGDQSGCPSTEVFEGEPELGHESRPEVLDQDVRAGGEAADRIDSFLHLEIRRDRALVPVERQVVGGVVPHEGRSPVAGVVAVFGALDLDDVGAKVTQDLGRERSGEHPRKVQDAEAGQREVVHGAEDTRLIWLAHQGALPHNWRIAMTIRENPSVNEQSLERVNAFLAAVAGRTEKGELLEATPAEIGRELDFPDPLSIARAVRALVARRRLEPAGGSYRLLDGTPVAEGERETIERRGRRSRKQHEDTGTARRGGLAYSDLGRATVDRLVELGQEVSQLRAQLKTSREEARQNREMRAEAERRARTLAERARELEHRVEMAESNLRTLLASARATGMHPDQRLPDSEMEAILGVLKGNGEQPSEEETPRQLEQMDRPTEESRFPVVPAEEA